MIALEPSNGKGLDGPSGDHGFVNEIMNLPHFGQGVAKLPAMMATVASGPVLKEFRIPQPPSPPGLSKDRA